MSPFFSQDQIVLRARVREWTERHLFTDGSHESDVETSARTHLQQLAQEGFLRYIVPAAYGGVRTEVQARDFCILREELARGDALADAMFAVQALASYPVTLYGTNEQRQLYLTAMGSGEAIGAFALTEPEAGSDVSVLQTRAVRRGDQYCLTGTKRFVSNAGIADRYIVFASTQPEKKTKGTSAFVVDAKTPGITLKEKTRLISPHPIGVIAFEGCMIPETARLGEEGEGLKIAFSTLDVLRCTVGAAAAGLAQRALEEAVAYCRKRRQFNRPLAEFQGIQFKIADMAADLEASRLLVYHAAWDLDNGSAEAKRKSSMAKLFATEAAQRIVDQALQIHGGMGLVSGSVMERLYRDVRALRIYEGTSEIQKLIIARELLNDV
jgi:acyl-CoA dehydrogenase